MRPKHLFFLFISFVCLNESSQAQLLKKIKDKVKKTVGNDDEKKEDNSSSSSDNSSSSSSSNNSSNENTKGPRWCEGIVGDGNGGGSKDGVDFKKVFSNANGFQILYDESSLGLSSDAKGFRLVISERVNNKTQYKVIENGNVVASGPEVKAEWLGKASAGQRQMKNASDDQQSPMSKYIVGDTIKHNIPKTDAKKVTIQKTDDDQVEMALNIARQTDDYKNMSDAEKKEFEESVKAGIAKNNSMAGTSFDIPASQGGTVASVNGYFLIVKGKKYGKFMMPPAVEVSRDETKVFAVGTNEQGKPVMIANGKTTLLDPNKYSAVNGRIIKSTDQTKFVYLEQKKMSEKELEQFTNATSTTGHPVVQYSVIKGDGSSLLVTDHNYNGKFKLTNTGEILYINEETGEVFSNDKQIGKFSLARGERIESDAVMIGSDLSKLAYYNGSDGSLIYLDGSVKKMDIMFPKVVSEGGKSYLSWFRKCGNDIYIARFGY